MTTEIKRLDDSAAGPRHFRYFDYVMAAFVTILLLSNLIGAAKQATITLPVIGPWTYGAGVLFFPVSYILGDVLTEVYGYANARRCVWAGFAALLFMAFMSYVVVALPPASGWSGQAAYESVFGSTWRIVAASVIASSTASSPSVSTAASTRTNRRSASSPVPSLRRSRASAGGNSQPWNGAPLRNAPGFFASTGR